VHAAGLAWTLLATSEAQVLAVLAHEVGHVLQFEAVNGGSSIQSIFIEGFATWVAGPYWLDWQGVHSFQSAVKSYLDSGTYISLHENDESFDTTSDDAELRFGRDCLNMRDIIYTEWAAFIDYLVEEYGREKLLSLFQAAPIGAVDDQTRYKQPNFPEIYGASLEQLEVAWLQSLEASD
jgi:hypothetical protein